MFYWCCVISEKIEDEIAGVDGSDRSKLECARDEIEFYNKREEKMNKKLNEMCFLLSDTSNGTKAATEAAEEHLNAKCSHESTVSGHGYRRSLCLEHPLLVFILEAADLLHNLSIDSQAKYVNIAEPTKKALVYQYGRVDLGVAVNGQIQPSEHSLTPFIPDIMDPTN